jgi:hypothetical protein
MSSNRSDPFHRRFQLHSLFRFNAVYILLILYCITVSGCETDPLVDRSFITGQPCESPCWYGIRVGETEEAAVKAILSELPFVKQGSVRITMYEDGINYSFSCSHPDDENCGDIILENGKVDRIIVSVHFPLTFEQVVEKLGMPDHVHFDPYHPDTGGCIVSLEWPQGILVKHLEVRKDKYCRELARGEKVDPRIQVTGLIYTSQKDLSNSPCNQSNCINWPGFKNP